MLQNNDFLQKKLEEVFLAFQERALDAVKKITSLIDSADERIALDASKYTIKSIGGEIDQVKHSGKVEFTPVKFSREDDKE